MESLEAKREFQQLRRKSGTGPGWAGRAVAVAGVLSRRASGIWSVVPAGNGQEFENAASQFHVMHTKMIRFLELAPPRSSTIERFMRRAL